MKVYVTRCGDQHLAPGPWTAWGSQVETTIEKQQEVGRHWSGKALERPLKKQYGIIIITNNGLLCEPGWDGAVNKAERKK